jgi:hypothetical protein
MATELFGSGVARAAMAHQRPKTPTAKSGAFHLVLMLTNGLTVSSSQEDPKPAVTPISHGFT